MQNIVILGSVVQFVALMGKIRLCVNTTFVNTLELSHVFLFKNMHVVQCCVKSVYEQCANLSSVTALSWSRCSGSRGYSQNTGCLNGMLVQSRADTHPNTELNLGAISCSQSTYCHVLGGAVQNTQSPSESSNQVPWDCELAMLPNSITVTLKCANVLSEQPSNIYLILLYLSLNEMQKFEPRLHLMYPPGLRILRANSHYQSTVCQTNRV